MGVPRRLDQQGVSIFELSIILLILLLVGISLWVMVAHIQKDSNNNYKRVDGVNRLVE